MTVHIVSVVAEDTLRRFESESHASFLCRASWAAFQTAAGHTVIPAYAVDTNNQVLAAGYAVRLPWKAGIAFLSSNFGPCIHPSVFEDEAFLTDVLRSWVTYVREHAGAGDALLRMQPSLELGTAHGEMYERVLRGLGALPAPRAFSPVHSSVVDLSLPEEERFARMHSKTRYNIRLAAKKGVTIRNDASSAGVDAFLGLLRSTAGRQEFSLHPDAYYRTLLAQLAPSGVADLFLAECEGVCLAAALIAFTEDRATYLHGASSEERRDLMAPFALHDAVIRTVAARGCTTYDFWGTAPVDAPATHPWAGISRFKRGFGGRDTVLTPAYDVPLRRWSAALLRRLGR